MPLFAPVIRTRLPARDGMSAAFHFSLISLLDVRAYRLRCELFPPSFVCKRLYRHDCRAVRFMPHSNSDVATVPCPWPRIGKAVPATSSKDAKTDAGAPRLWLLWCNSVYSSAATREATCFCSYLICATN